MSGFLLDTNVISELVRPQPNPKVRRWILTNDEELLFLSVLTIGEIRKGIAALSDPSRITRLETWLTQSLLPRFEGRIVPINQATAERWGRIAGVLARQGSNLPVVDGLLAATALQNNLILVTRNTRHLTLAGVSVFDPWT